MLIAQLQGLQRLTSISKQNRTYPYSPFFWVKITLNTDQFYEVALFISYNKWIVIHLSNFFSIVILFVKVLLYLWHSSRHEVLPIIVNSLFSNHKPPVFLRFFSVSHHLLKVSCWFQTQLILIISWLFDLMIFVQIFA